MAVAGGITGTAVWLAQPSYDAIVKGCTRAPAVQSKVGARGNPAACDDVKKDDYDAPSSMTSSWPTGHARRTNPRLSGDHAGHDVDAVRMVFDLGTSGLLGWPPSLVGSAQQHPATRTPTTPTGAGISDSGPLFAALLCEGQGAVSSVEAELVGVEREEFVAVGAGEVEQHDEGVGAGRPVVGGLDEPRRLVVGHAYGGRVVGVRIGPVDRVEQGGVDGLDAGGVGRRARRR
ncbi:hypothetical protein [Streptomyces mirabilis]|uniref:hypothetical protein n=1 Tax=Streptomyces mirabilis TaxID=68239 RepID=UPI003678DC82